MVSEIERLRAALKPFARKAGGCRAKYGCEFVNTETTIEVTLGECDAAAAALAPAPGEREADGCDRISEIRRRLAAVSGKPWNYNPKHEMFIGSTNALEMYDGVLDLGRDGKEFFPYQDETGSGYRLTEASRQRMERIKALGEFLQSCREDIEYLLALRKATHA